MKRIRFLLLSGSQLHKIVSSFNLIRFLLDGKQVANPQYAFDYLETVRRKTFVANRSEFSRLFFSRCRGSSTIDEFNGKTTETSQQFSSNSFRKAEQKSSRTTEIRSTDASRRREVRRFCSNKTNGDVETTFLPFRTIKKCEEKRRSLFCRFEKVFEFVVFRSSV